MVKPVAETHANAILGDSLTDPTRLNTPTGLGWIVVEYPTIAVVDDLEMIFDPDYRKPLNNATGIVGDLA
jgi:hypothetical protein